MRQGDCRQSRDHGAGHMGLIVDADHGDVLGHTKAPMSSSQEHPHGGAVIGGDHGARLLS